MVSELIVTEYGLLSSELHSEKLAQLCEPKVGVQTGPFGSQLHKKDYVEVGTPIITVEHLGENRIRHTDTPYVSDHDKDRLSKYSLKEGDIVFSRVGSVDRRSLVRKAENGWLFSGRCLRVRVDKNKINPSFLSYFFGYEGFKNHIKGIAVGATMPSINTKILSEVRIFYPSLTEQKAIAHILGSLDDKIELNRQMNETLEAMAQALFKSWFVDFDPVIDNALAASNAIPDEFIERAEQRKAIEKKEKSDIQGLFPDEFELTEGMGWIPKGWEITNLKDHAEKISKGTTPSKAILAKADDDSTIPFLKVRDLDDKGKIDTQNLDLIPKSIHENALKRSILQTGDLLFSIAGTIGRVSIVPKELDNSNSNQALAFIRPKDDIKTYFLLQFLKSQEVQDEISSRVVQAVQANVSLTELGSLKFATASDDLFRKWHSMVQSWIEKINLLQIENSYLSKLRDTLLPKLMSGELRIPDAAALVDEAL